MPCLYFDTTRSSIFTACKTPSSSNKCYQQDILVNYMYFLCISWAASHESRPAAIDLGLVLLCYATQVVARYFISLRDAFKFWPLPLHILVDTSITLAWQYNVPPSQQKLKALASCTVQSSIYAVIFVYIFLTLLVRRSMDATAAIHIYIHHPRCHEFLWQCRRHDQVLGRLYHVNKMSEPLVAKQRATASTCSARILSFVICCNASLPFWIFGVKRHRRRRRWFARLFYRSIQPILIMHCTPVAKQTGGSCGPSIAILMIASSLRLILERR